MTADLEARLFEVEKKCQQTDARLDALVDVLADLLAAHAMTADDIRPLEMLRERCQSDHQKWKAGGNDRTPASYFEHRLEVYASVLEGVAASEMPERYWQPSVFKWIDFRQWKAIRQKEDRFRGLSDW